MERPERSMEYEARLASQPEGTLEPPDSYGVPASLSCPACGGTLWELSGDGPPRFRCRTGHGYSAMALSREQWHTAESVLGAALRAFKERAALQERMSLRCAQGGQERLAECYRQGAEEAKRHTQQAAALIASMATAGDPGHPAAKPAAAPEKDRAPGA